MLPGGTISGATLQVPGGSNMAVQPNNSAKGDMNLTKILCAEMSAVETYDHALQNFTKGEDRDKIELARDCHVKRVDTLAGKLYEMGGSPTESSGVWGAFTRVLDAGVGVVTDKMAIALLEEGEERTIQQYRDLIAGTKQEPDVQTLASVLLTQQEATQRMIKEMQERMERE
jgi:hypothetical protein